MLEIFNSYLFPEQLTQATCFEKCFEINSEIKNDGVPKDLRKRLYR